MNRKYWIASLFLLVFIFTIVIEAQAVPAFARKYKLSCSTCHAPFPKLKPYGDNFAGAGFILDEEESERYYVSAGDEILWLNRTFPVAARLEGYGQYDQDHDVESDLQTPYGLKLMSGGTLYKNIGYYFYFYMDERGEVAGVEDAYVHFDNVFKSNLDIMVGQFQTSDPLMKRELRLTYEDYEIYTRSVGLSYTNLTYDRGVMLVYGIEQTGTDLIGMIVNGNGKVESGGDHKFDFDTNKNFGLRVNQGVGSLGSIGLFYYNGAEQKGNIANKITYWGPDISVNAGPLELTAQYIVREDSSPLFGSWDVLQDIQTNGIVAELIFSPYPDRPRWYLTALYNRIESDLDDLSDKAIEYAGMNLDPLAYHTATFSGTYLLARNLRLLCEYTYDLEYETNRITVGFVTGM